MAEPEPYVGHRARLRQRFLADPIAVSEADLLELLLTYAIPRVDVAPQAASLLDRFGDLDGVLAAPYSELAQAPGIGEHTATLIKLVARLAGRTPGPIQKASDPAQQPTLFEVQPELGSLFHTVPGPTQAEPQMRTFANDEIANCLTFLPQAAQFDSLETFKAHLQAHLPYNSESTRQRRANYILDRFYPQERLDIPLTYFAAHFPVQDLKPVVFYHVLKAEPMVAKIADEFIWPALPVGYIQRDDMRAFILRFLPDIGASSQKNMLRSVMTTYTLLDVGTQEDTRLRFQAHAGTLAGFLYVLTAEFSQPGIYTFEAMENGPLRHWLLWDREWMRRQLYNLRDLGVIAKVSEIDTVRQFTLPYDQATSLCTFFEHPQRETMALRDNGLAYELTEGKG